MAPAKLGLRRISLKNEIVSSLTNFICEDLESWLYWACVGWPTGKSENTVLLLRAATSRLSTAAAGKPLDPPQIFLKDRLWRKKKLLRP